MLALYLAGRPWGAEANEEADSCLEGRGLHVRPLPPVAPCDEIDKTKGPGTFTLL
jgi:hypothetical protein